MNISKTNLCDGVTNFVIVRGIRNRAPAKYIYSTFQPNKSSKPKPFIIDMTEWQTDPYTVTFQIPSTRSDKNGLGVSSRIVLYYDAMGQHISETLTPRPMDIMKRYRNTYITNTQSFQSMSISCFNETIPHNRLFMSKDIPPLEASRIPTLQPSKLKLLETFDIFLKSNHISQIDQIILLLILVIICILFCSKN
jgi:hypothetical protein